MNLQRWGVQVQANCIRCNKVEDLHHIFVGCVWSILLCFATPLGLRLNFSNTGAFLHWLHDKLNSESDDVLALIIFAYCGIWTKRNEVYFKNKVVSPHEAAIQVFDLLTN